MLSPFGVKTPFAPAADVEWGSELNSRPGLVGRVGMNTGSRLASRTS